MTTTFLSPSQIESINKNTKVAYHPLPDFEKELQFETRHFKTSQLGPLTLSPEAISPTPLWVKNIWYEPRLIRFNSIGDAAKALRSLNMLWVTTPFKHHRRTQLILDNLPKLKDRSVHFLGPLPKANLGGFFLLDENTLMASPHCSSPFPNGEFQFSELSPDAPSRAYLKLWEFFTLTGKYPEPNMRVADFGSCPGGWTWVLSRLGCEVYSIDKAPLDERLQSQTNIHFLSRDAFRVKPEELPTLDWFFSDIICEPKRLLDLIELWHHSKRAKNFLCTIKFKGTTDYEIIEEFRKKDGASLLHLHHNKHELTFYWPEKK